MLNQDRIPGYYTVLDVRTEQLIERNTLGYTRTTTGAKLLYQYGNTRISSNIVFTFLVAGMDLHV